MARIRRLVMAVMDVLCFVALGLILLIVSYLAAVYFGGCVFRFVGLWVDLGSLSKELFNQVLALLIFLFVFAIAMFKMGKSREGQL